ncbi:hypothetical protein [Pedobacter sp.]|uniref:hypothetical protein n=1 Tax=Pedobacter sp. TaxID=1411316 RepID=UPI003BA9AD7E
MLKLRSRQTGREWSLDRIRFIKEDVESYFLVESSEDASINYTVSFPLHVYEGYLPQNFTCVGFSSSIFNKENNIFQVNLKQHIVKAARIGWIFTIQALISKEHNEADNQHFLRYAFVTFEKLLRGELFPETLILMDDIGSGGALALESIYPSDLIVLSISNNTITGIPKFNIDNYLQSFYAYGYYFCPSLADFDSSVENPVKPPIVTSISIQKISDNLEDNDFAKTLFKTYLKKQNHPLVQFYLLFQIIELLIDKVYDFEIIKIFNEAQARSLPPHDIKKKIEATANMDYRITRLFEDYLRKGLSSTADLIVAIKPFMNHFSQEINDTTPIGAAIYACRNKIVHEFRIVADQDVDFKLLKVINMNFSQLVAELVVLFSNEKAVDNELNSAPLEWLKYQLQQES